MNRPADFHTHSLFSSDSDAKPEENIKAAINLGLSSICFTEHNDFDFPPEDNKDVLFQLDFDNYISSIASIKELYSEQIPVYIGVEQGLCRSAADRINDYDKNHILDFIIGSSHLVYGNDPYYPKFWEGRNIDEVIYAYYESILDNLDTCNNFDIYGHIDYIIRYIPDKSYEYNYKNFSDIIDEVLKKIIYNGKGIEINTAGLRYGLNATNPSAEIVLRYRELGGEIITIGSDAHYSCDIGSGFDIAYDMLKSCNFKYYNIFRKRKPEFIQL
ncbi:MAG: histidinol-phosphatase HisJ family protein [Eubacterium sp.]|nr:histidinol-phosphatase HisJ family protein [Eubacterium sp.]